MTRSHAGDASRQLPSRSALAAHWGLDPDVVFLNHGSFGATPIAVLRAQSKLRSQLEAEPVRFMVRELEPLLDEARNALAAFVGASPERLVFVQNATTGVSTVLRSLALRAGDELLTTDHEYNACKNALDFVAEASGARVVVVQVPFPLSGDDEVVQAIAEATTERTRLILVDHVTSPTGLVMPVERIVAEANARGVDVLVDGAHAPGMVPLALDALGAAYYTANCHKWICAPKGAALLYVRDDKAREVRPLSISHGANSPRGDRSRLRLEFDWCGTTDPTAAIAVKEAIAFMQQIVAGGFDEVMRRNRSLALHARAVLCDALSVAAPCPDSMIGSLAAVVLPDRRTPAAPSASMTEPLQDRLYFEHGIEVPVPCWPASPHRLVRISAQLYNSLAEYNYLARALIEELALEAR
jgi:isopenicillin-N epimerase